MISEFRNMEQGLLFSSYLQLDKVVWQNVPILAKNGACVAVQCKLSGQDCDIRAKAPNTEWLLEGTDQKHNISATKCNFSACYFVCSHLCFLGEAYCFLLYHCVGLCGRGRCRPSATYSLLKEHGH